MNIQKTLAYSRNILIGSAFGLLTACAGGGGGGSDMGLLSVLLAPGSGALGPATTALWARSVTTGSSNSIFNSTAVDSSGNVYAVGSISGTGTYTFGGGITAAGTFVGGSSVVLVKYNTSGIAQYARTVTTGSNKSSFNSVSVDSSGNVYAVGSIYGTGTYTFGTGVTAAGTYGSGDNVVLVKYNSSGTAQWARTVTTGPATSVFNAVTLDSSGNIFAGGYFVGTSSYTFAAGVSVSCSWSALHAMLVKYDTSGTAQWARTVTSGVDDTNYNALSADSSGNVYAVGDIYGASTNTFFTGVTAAGVYSGNNAVLVKYNSSGTAQWAKTVTGALDNSEFFSVATDSAGNIYATGYIAGTKTFGAGVSVTGTATSNMVLVKYNSSGAAQWGRSMIAGSSGSVFYSVTVDSAGNIFASGSIYGTGSDTFDTGVTAGGASTIGNVLLVKYNSSGTAQWARSVITGSMDSVFNAVTADSSGNVYAVGSISDTETYTFGTVTVSGTSIVKNSVIVKYLP